MAASHAALELLKSPNWKAADLVATLTEWLARERRQIEAATGRPLMKAWIVRVDEKDVVARWGHGRWRPGRAARL